MGVDADLERWLEVDSGEPGNGDEHAWNILVQVLLPLVFVLTFVIITSVHAYRTAAEAAWEILDKDESLASLQLKETLLELQLQKLLNALREVEARAEADLGLGLFPTPERIQRQGSELRDEGFKRLCQTGLDLQRTVQPTWTDRLYLEVLEVAALTDPRPLPVRRWPEEEAAVDRVQTQVAQPTMARSSPQSLPLRTLPGPPERPPETRPEA